MAQRKLLTNGSAFKRTDDRWCGVVWYMDRIRAEKKKKLLRHHQSRSQQENDRVCRRVQSSAPAVQRK